MISPFLISVREGLEMALIVAIVLAYLAKTGNRAHFKYVWLGLGGAIAVSALAATGIFLIAGELAGPAEMAFEGVTMLIAVVILTWMIFWMRKVSRNIKRELEMRVDTAMDVGSSLALASLVFVAVVREGLEEALFLFSASRTSTAGESVVGAGLGLALAAFLGYAMYSGSRWLNLRAFFNVTGVVLILVAAGLLAHGLHEFIELKFVPPIIETVWDTNGIIDEDGVFGGFLKAVFGYNGNPALIEVMAYFAYASGCLLAFVRPLVGARVEKAKTSTSAA